MSKLNATTMMNAQTKLSDGFAPLERGGRLGKSDPSNGIAIAFQLINV